MTARPMGKLAERKSKKRGANNELRMPRLTLTSDGRFEFGGGGIDVLQTISSPSRKYSKQNHLVRERLQSAANHVYSGMWVLVSWEADLLRSVGTMSGGFDNVSGRWVVLAGPSC